MYEVMIELIDRSKEFYRFEEKEDAENFKREEEKSGEIRAQIRRI